MTLDQVLDGYLIRGWPDVHERVVSHGLEDLDEIEREIVIGWVGQEVSDVLER